jgi:DNA-binding transcriptional ArsR family regulator
MMILLDIMRALADPTRRVLLDRLRAGPLPVCQLAAGLPISRPAVSQHLRILSDAGLLTVTPKGNRRFYAIAPAGVQDLRTYLDSLWDDALADFADNMAMEYRIASRVIVRPDFTEGVRAVIVDKDNAPKWDPATAEDVTADLIDAIFAPLPAQEEWVPL